MKKTQVITRQKMLVEKGSGNVYADLGFPDSADMLVKAQLVTKIAEIIRQRRLTQAQAAKLLRLSQPKISRLLCGESIGSRRSNCGETYAPTARPRSTDRALRLTSKRALKTHRPAIFFNVCSAVHSLFIRLY